MTLTSKGKKKRLNDEIILYRNPVSVFSIILKYSFTQMVFYSFTQNLRGSALSKYQSVPKDASHQLCVGKTPWFMLYLRNILFNN